MHKTIAPRPERVTARGANTGFPGRTRMADNSPVGESRPVLNWSPEVLDAPSRFTIASSRLFWACTPEPYETPFGQPDIKCEKSVSDRVIPNGCDSDSIPNSISH